MTIPDIQTIRVINPDSRPFLDGRQTAHISLRNEGFRPGRAFIVCYSGDWAVRVRITHVYLCPLNELPETVAVQAGYQTRAEVLASLKTRYPQAQVNETTRVVVVIWDDPQEQRTEE